MASTVETVWLTSVTEEQARAIARVIEAVWPKLDRGETERAEQFKRMGAEYRGPAERGPACHIVRDGDTVIAHAATFLRTIRAGGAEHPALALAMVASDPERRGEGLGLAVVRAAFDRVDAGHFPFSLFQTSFGVQRFYERLGSCLVENKVVNSRSESNPDANPFWDDVVMRYPATAPWPEGPIDLNGRGY